MSLISKKHAIKIIKEGKFYCPAISHYGKNLEVNNVNCDYCGKSQLPVFVGYSKYDFCMTCVNELTYANKTFTSLPNPDNNTIDLQEADDRIVTKMMQQSVRRTDDRIVTKMMQQSVRRTDIMTRPVTLMMQPSVRPTIWQSITEIFKKK